MKKREITNNELDQLFDIIIEQAPLMAEDQVNALLVALPTVNHGSALKRFFQNRLNTILLSASLIVIAISVALIWTNSVDTTETSVVESFPQHTIITPVSADTIETDNAVVEFQTETITNEVIETVMPATKKEVEKISVNEASPLPLPLPKPIIQDTLTMEKLYKQLEKNPQTFSIKTDKDTVITCNEGTTLEIKANSFISEETGKLVTGNVEIAINEFYNISDIVLANLTTTSGNRMLESGGMLNISATANNENCVIKPGEAIEIGFPYQIKKDDMKLFYGEQTVSGMEWELAQSTDDVAIQDEIFIEDTEADVVTYVNVSPVIVRKVEAEMIIVEQMPQFPGGYNAMEKYIQDRAIYPYSELKERPSGRVEVRCTIDKNGDVGNVYVVKGINNTLDKLAAYIVSNMPQWKPGKQRGKAVDVSYTILVYFNPKEGEKTDREIEEAKKLDAELDTFNFDLINNSYHAELIKFEEKVKDNNFKETNIVEVRRYLFNTTRLGWINCDRFYKYNKPAVDFFIRTENADQIMVNAIFNRFKGMVQGTYKNGKIHFDRIPEGEKMTFVAIKTFNNQIYLASKETVVTENGEMEQDFQPVTLELLKKEMEKLNKLF